MLRRGGGEHSEPPLPTKHPDRKGYRGKRVKSQMARVYEPLEGNVRPRGEFEISGMIFALCAVKFSVKTRITMGIQVTRAS